MSEMERLQNTCTFIKMNQNDLVRNAITAYLDAVGGTVDPAVLLHSVRQSYATHLNSTVNAASAEVGTSYQDIIDKLGGS